MRCAFLRLEIGSATPPQARVICVRMGEAQSQIARTIGNYFSPLNSELSRLFVRELNSNY
jgi:hypothetical protein